MTQPFATIACCSVFEKYDTFHVTHHRMSDDFCAVIAPNKLFPVSQFDFLALQKMTLVIFLAVT